jgi:hypothetical protein
MKIWTEVQKDAYSYFDWFSKERAVSMYGFVPELSVCSINCERCFRGVNEFKRMCVKLVSELKRNIYLFSVRKVDTASRVANYLKLWNEMDRQWNISGFNLGEELLEYTGGCNYYYGLSRIDGSSINKGIDILMWKPHRILIFASNTEINLNDSQYAQDIFEFACNRSDYIDLFLGILLLSQKFKDAIIFRYGDSSEDKEFDCITNCVNLGELQSKIERL